MSSRVWILSILAALGLASSQCFATTLLISNEKGSSISTLNTSTGVVGTFMSGLSSPDGLVNASDGFLYATSFSGGTLNRITSSTTSTVIASGFNGAGALVADSAGNFYVPNFGAPNGGGSSVGKVSPNGIGGYNTIVNFAIGLSTPDGMAFNNGRTILYEADFGSNRINKIDTSNGTVTTFVAGTAGLSRPASIVVDSLDNLYLSNFGDANGNGGFISKITSAGVVTNNYVTGLSSPLGLLLDEAHSTFYVSSWNGNTISSAPMAGGTPTIVANNTSGLNGPTHMVVMVPEPSVMIVAIAGFVGLMRPRRRQRCQ